jgi:muramoyltetrapeptide carboxypeptidase
MRIPELLKKGDQIALISPAKKIQTDLQPSIDIIKNWGLTPVIGKNSLNVNHYFAGTDSERLSDLQWALDNPKIKAILMARGGYGTTRIVDQIDWTLFDQNPKWICGFSDITALITTMNNRGIACIHGPLGVTLPWDQQSTESLKTMFMEGKVSYSLPASPRNVNGIAKAPLTGGNLSIICNSIGTPSEINTDNKILFLEEVGEYYYHLDRMLTQLNRSGKLKNLKGLIIGDFSSMKDHKDSFGKEPMEIIAEYFSHLNIPQVYGFPLGHEKRNVPVYCGALVVLDVNQEKTLLSFDLSTID